MAIVLPDDTRKEIIQAIKHYFMKERDEEIGDLSAGFFLDFFLKEIGPSIYNRAIRDAQAHLQRVVADLDVSLYES